MRNEQAFAIPIEFSWNVAARGYRWISQSGKRYLCAIDALEQPDWPGMLGTYERTYRPLEERTGLFREFVELKPTEAQILEFANRYGQLGLHVDLPHEAPFGLTLLRCETLEAWKQEIEDLTSAVSLWDALAAGRREELARFKGQFDLEQLPLAFQRRFHLDEDDPAMAALSAIQTRAEARLIKNVAARLLFPGNRPRLRVCLTPLNLLGAIWLQFVAAVDVLKRFQKCAQCGAPFEISRDPRTGKRIDARFCSTRCRVNQYRDRIERARRLRVAGRSDAEIARELGTRAGIVKSWLKKNHSHRR